MLIKQLSIFLENKCGRFTEVTQILGKEGINMTAFTVSENSDFGILRLIVSDADKALEVLRAERYAVSVTEVVCIQCPNEPGSLARVMTLITEAGVFIEYMYAFSQDPVARVIIRPDNMERCVDVLKQHKIGLLAASDFYRL